MSDETEPNKSTESGPVWQQLDVLLTDTQTHDMPLTPQEIMSNIDAVVQDAEQKRAQQQRRQRQRRLFVALLVSVAAISVVVLICNAATEELKRGMDEMIADHPVTYTMPAAAQIIDKYTSLADWFGDFEYCAAFRVSDAEYDRLLRNGFNWIYMGRGSTTPTPDVLQWRTGHLPEHDLSIGDCFNRLTTKPDKSIIYRYLLEEGQDWIYLLAVDEKDRIIFYYRCTT